MLLTACALAAGSGKRESVPITAPAAAEVRRGRVRSRLLGFVTLEEQREGTAPRRQVAKGEGRAGRPRACKNFVLSACTILRSLCQVCDRLVEQQTL